jgi:ribose 1,5-bisphosphokinase PhnN
MKSDDKGFRKLTPRGSLDWKAIEREYRAGQLSVREIAKAHGISHTAIQKRPAREAWERNQSEAVALQWRSTGELFEVPAMVGRRLGRATAGCSRRSSHPARRRANNRTPTMTDATPSNKRSRAAERMRLSRERRRNGTRCLTIETSRNSSRGLIRIGRLPRAQRADHNAVREGAIWVSR